MHVHASDAVKCGNDAAAVCTVVCINLDPIHIAVASMLRRRFDRASRSRAMCAP